MGKDPEGSSIIKPIPGEGPKLFGAAEMKQLNSRPLLSLKTISEGAAESEPLVFSDGLSGIRIADDGWSAMICLRVYY